MNEVKLILECQKGEKKAFNELIENYYPYVSKFLRKLTGNEEISQDLVQETFLKLIVNIDKFDVKGKATFSTYLMKIAKNCYLDYLKNKKVSILAVQEVCMPFNKIHAFLFSTTAIGFYVAVFLFHNLLKVSSFI